MKWDSYGVQGDIYVAHNIKNIGISLSTGLDGCLAEAAPRWSNSIMVSCTQVISKADDTRSGLVQ